MRSHPTPLPTTAAGATRRADRSILRRAGLTGFCVLTLGVLPGCDGSGGAERVPLDRGQGSGETAEALPEALQARLDSGNAAYRERDYERALTHFQAVTESAPGLAAGWYGIGMTQSALGNDPAADSARMRVHGLAPEVPLEHPSGAAPPNPHAAPPNPHSVPPPDPGDYED
jgi:tetratricopeptide (TPR) repeat protein